MLPQLQAQAQPRISLERIRCTVISSFNSVGIMHPSDVVVSRSFGMDSAELARLSAYQTDNHSHSSGVVEILR